MYVQFFFSFQYSHFSICRAFGELYFGHWLHSANNTISDAPTKHSQLFSYRMDYTKANKSTLMMAEWNLLLGHLWNDGNDMFRQQADRQVYFIDFYKYWPNHSYSIRILHVQFLSHWYHVWLWKVVCCVWAMYWICDLPMLAKCMYIHATRTSSAHCV